MKEIKLGEEPKDTTILVENFFEIGRPLRACHLGWTKEYKIEAKTSVSKKIFNYYFDRGFNIIFYYTKDENFYGIASEFIPAPVYRIKRTYDTEIIQLQIDDDTDHYEDGEILYWIEDGQDAWETIKIGGASMEEVIQYSHILIIN